MRKKSNKQLPLSAPVIDHPQAKELETISRILDRNATITDLLLQDLCNGKAPNATGAEGMSAEQILRVALVKQMFGFSYQQLAFHLADSMSLQCFCRVGIAGRVFKKSALANNIKRIGAKSLEAINRILTGAGKADGVEKGREVRIDSTVVESNIHHPTDSSLLYDSVRVLSRILGANRLRFTNHCRRAKRRMMAVINARKQKERVAAYKDLLKVTAKTVGYAQPGIEQLEQRGDLQSLAACMELKRFVCLATRVMEQCRRRVIEGQTVPAAEKVVSIFEPHTDVIVKDRRETYFGHKVCLTVGASQLITDCVITEGNPADSDLTLTMLDRQKQIYGRYPLKVALDGGFASKNNLSAAKSRGIKDVCFAKKRGLTVEQMCRSQWVYDRLRRFRAGVESVISWLKRALGFDRCPWKGRRSFGSYVWLTVVAANLKVLARAATQ